MAILNTGFKLPTAVIPNTSGVPDWTTPNNILLVDQQYAVAGGVTQILTVGNFNHNIPIGSSILNITIRFNGYRGSFNTTLQPFAVDDTTGVTLSYPYLPTFQSFTGVDAQYTLLPTLFATTWTVNQANNIKIALIADGELFMDSVEVDIQYDDNVVVPAVPTSGGSVVCSEFVQAQPFTLARAMSSTDLTCFLTSFNYPSATGAPVPIAIADFYGEAMLTVDQGKSTEENVRITNVEQDYQGTGQVRLSFTSLANRGLDFKYPYTSNPTRILSHTGTAELVISNNAPFNDRFLKKCQIDALVSAPIEILDEGVSLTTAVHSIDFTGGGVMATTVGQAVTVNIPGAGTTPPATVSTSSATTGAVPAASLTWSHDSSGLNRGLLVQISSLQTTTITGVTYNGIPLVQQVSLTDVVNNLRSEQWFLVAPPIGTYNIVVTFSGLTSASAGAETYASVDQTTPIGVTQTASGNSNAPSLILVTTANNSLVVDSLTTGLLPIVYVPGAGQSSNWTQTVNPNIRQGGSSTEQAGLFPDPVTMNYAITQITPWVYTAVEINGISSTLATLAVLDESVLVDGSVAFMNFVGPGVVATQTSAGHVDVTISGTTSNLSAQVNQVAHGLSVGQVIRSNGVANQFTQAQADSPSNAEAVGIVDSVIDANNFTYVSSATQLNGAFVPVGTPGDAIFLDPTVAGGLTVTVPSTIGQVIRPLGTLLDSGLTMYFDIADFGEELITPVSAVAIGDAVGGSVDGSVLFIDGGGLLAQDNANFFYDNPNNSLGLGTTTPLSIGGIFTAPVGQQIFQNQNLANLAVNVAAGTGAGIMALMDISAAANVKTFALASTGGQAQMIIVDDTGTATIFAGNIDLATGFAHFGSGAAATVQLQVTGDAYVTGKLTVDGIIDPTAVEITSSATGNYLTLADGSTAVVSAAGEGRIVYDAGSNTFKKSENGGAYSAITGGTVPVYTNVFTGVNFGNLYYLNAIWGSATGVEASAQSPTPTGNIDNLRVAVRTNTLTGATLVTLRVNGVSTALTVSIGAGATGQFAFSSPIAITAGDLIGWEIDTTASGAGLIQDMSTVYTFT